MSRRKLLRAVLAFPFFRWLRPRKHFTVVHDGKIYHFYPDEPTPPNFRWMIDDLENR